MWGGLEVTQNTYNCTKQQHGSCWLLQYLKVASEYSIHTHE